MNVRRGLQRAWVVMNPWEPRVRDARRRLVPLFKINKAWTDREQLPAPVFTRVRGRLLGVTRKGMGMRPVFLWAMAALYLALFLLLAWYTLRSAGPRLMLISFAINPLIFAWGAVMYRYRIPKAGREEIVAAMLAERRCASCAYDLAAVPPDGRSWTVCPECGAAWVMPVGAGG